MDEDHLNLEIRKFLITIGIKSQYSSSALNDNINNKNNKEKNLNFNFDVIHKIVDKIIIK